MRRLVRWHADERVDLPDADQIAGEMELLESARQARCLLLPTGRTTGYAATSARIFGGFDVSNVVGGTCDLSRGTGLLPVLRDGDIVWATVTGEEGEATQAIDLSAQPDDTYAIYVRAVYSDGSQENRVHWDDTGSEEVVLFVNTREHLSWEWTYRSTSASAPSGGDWVKAWELTVATAVITVQADCRHFFFEGDGSSAVSQWGHEWGDGANDRNVDRALYGVGDLHRFSMLVRRQLADIIGVSWYTEAPTDLTTVERELGILQNGFHDHFHYKPTAESEVVDPGDWPAWEAVLGGAPGGTFTMKEAIGGSGVLCITSPAVAGTSKGISSGNGTLTNGIHGWWRFVSAPFGGIRVKLRVPVLNVDNVYRIGLVCATDSTRAELAIYGNGDCKLHIVDDTGADDIYSASIHTLVANTWTDFELELSTAGSAAYLRVGSAEAYEELTGGFQFGSDYAAAEMWAESIAGGGGVAGVLDIDKITVYPVA